MKDYEYYKDEMKRDPIQIIEGQGAMDENILLGKMLTWLPRKIFGAIFKRKKDNTED